MKKIPMLCLAVLLLILTGCAAPYEYKGTYLDPPEPLDDFTVQTTQGDTVNLSDFEGELMLLYFGYTYCPDICPTTLAQMRKTMELLGEDAEQVQAAMLTVDPARDSLEGMGEYLARFDDSFIGFHTADDDNLIAILEDFGVYSNQEESIDGGYLIGHTSHLFLLNQQMEIVVLFSYGTPPEDIAEDVRQILKGR